MNKYVTYKEELKEILAELGHKMNCEWNTDRAMRTLRATLHAMRNCLELEKSAAMFEYLPLSLKAIYADGWKVRKKDHPEIKDMDGLIEEVRKADGKSSIQDFTTTAEAKLTIALVFDVIATRIPPESMERLISLLPAGVRLFLGRRADHMNGDGVDYLHTTFDSVLLK